MHDDRYKAGDSMYGNGPFGMKWSLPRLDQGVSALLEDLHERGLLGETLVALVSEFGRTPRFEGKGRGRGHWPHCYSGLLAGGGVRAGAVYGSSDRQGAQVATGRPVAHPDFAATLFHALGIPPETRYGPDSFSNRISDGTPVLDLFG
jgi:arylsulfatase A-like enzyme